MKKRIYNIVIFMITMTFMLGGCSKKSEEPKVPEEKETIAFNTLEDQLFSYFSVELNQEEFKEDLVEGSTFTITPCIDFPSEIKIMEVKFDVVVPDSIQPLKEASYDLCFEAASNKKAESITFTLAKTAYDHQIQFTNIQAVAKRWNSLYSRRSIN